MKTGKRGAAVKDPGGQYVTTRIAAKLCGVSIFSIQRWFDEGLLTGSTLPGGWRRIAVGSINQFMRKHNMVLSADAQKGLHRVLLVDDDAKLLEIMKDSLAQGGKYLVRTASTGLEAGLAVMEFQPSTVVLDVMLEDVPGAQIVRRIRESSAGRGIRIVAIFGRAAPGDVDVVLSAGANAYLQKPFPMAELIKAIESRRTIRK